MFQGVEHAMKIVKLFSLKCEEKPLLYTGFGAQHEKKVREGRVAARFVHQVSRRIISYSVPQSRSVLFLLHCCIPIPYFPSSEKL